MICDAPQLRRLWNGRRPPPQPSPASAGLSGESSTATQTSLRKPNCNLRWIQSTSSDSSTVANGSERRSKWGTTTRKCNLRESPEASVATEKVSPDSPALAGEGRGGGSGRRNFTAPQV